MNMDGEGRGRFDIRQHGYDCMDWWARIWIIGFAGARTH